MIDIALCFSDNDGFFYRNAATTIVSVMENTKENLCFHIVHDDTLPLDKKDELTRIVERYKQKIQFYTAPAVSEEIIAAIPKHFGRGALYRLFLHHLLDTDKAIYLDCDIICEMDIKNLYAQDLGVMPLGAVIDTGMGKQNLAHIQTIGIKPEQYFNSGVLLLNMAWFRKNGDELLRLMPQELSLEKKIIFPVQTVMNTFFVKNNHKILYLDERFNYMLGFGGRTMQDFSVYKNKILHLTGEKPWKKFSNSALFYWKYYNKTPWGANAFAKLLDTPCDEETELFSFFLRGNKKDLAVMRRYRDLRLTGLWGYLKERILGK